MPNIYTIEVGDSVVEVEADDEASALAAAEQAVAQPPAATAAAQAPAAPAASSFMDMMGRVGGRAAPSPEQTQANVQLTKDVASGVARAPLTAAEGLGQLATRVGGSVLDDEAEAALNNRYDQAVKASRSGLSKTQLMASELAAGVLPIGAGAGASIATGLSKGGKVLAHLWQATKAAPIGAAVGASQYANESTSKWSQAGWGAAFPAAVQAVAGIRPVLYNTVAGWIQKADTARTSTIRDVANRFFEGSATQAPAYTVAQASGSSGAAALERRAQGSAIREQYATQLDATALRFEELAQQAEKAAAFPASSGNIASRSYRAVDALDSALRKARGKEWDIGMERVENLSATSTAKVELYNLTDEYGKIGREANNVFNLFGGDLPTGVKRGHAALLDTALETGKVAKTSAMGAGRVLKGLNESPVRGQAIVSATDAKVEAYRGRLLAALQKDLEQSGAATDPAFEALAATRQRYAARSARIERIENSAVNNLFGNKEALATPGAALDKLYAMKPEDMRFSMRVLRRRAPELVNAMSAHRIRTALNSSTVPGAAAESNFNATKFRDELFGGRNGLLADDLWSAEQKKVLKEGAAHLQVLMNHLPAKGQGSTVWPEEIAINLVSRSPEFIARVATRVAYGKWGDQLLGTEEGLRALRTFRNVGNVSAQSRAQAFSWVLNLANQEGEEDAAEAQNGQNLGQ